MSPRAAVLLIIAAVGVNHALFVALDGRVPPDLGLFFNELPRLWAHYDPTSLARTGGWYDGLLVLLFSLFGVGAAAFQVPGLAAVVTLVAAAGRLGGPRAAALVAALPMVWVQGRVGWIHVPEAALLLAAVAVWRADPDLGRPRTTVLLGGLGVLAALLRPSASAWLALLGVALGLRLRRRALPVVIAWAVAAVPAALEGRAYLAAKIAARARYTVDVPDLLAQVPITLGTLPTLCILVGLAAAPPRAIDRLLAAWAVLPVGLFFVFHAGIDNFTLGAVALAIVAAQGLGRLGRIGSVGPAVSLSLAIGVQWVPSPAPGTTAARIGGMLSLPVQDNLKNYARVHTGWGAAEVRALVAESCPQGPCTIGVVQGMFRPHGEDPGRFELFLSGIQEVQIADLRDHAGPPSRLAAVVQWECPDGDASWFRRFPDARANAQAAIRRADMHPVRQRQVDPGCGVTWWAGDPAREAPRAPHERVGPRGSSR